ncbi:MAG: hypothetical protein K6T28_08895 [Acidothermus sp.]|nr:hypothetical protein [Acidothermus sp.]
MRRLLSLAVALPALGSLLLSTPALAEPAVGSSDPSTLMAAVRDDAEWILQAQLPDGAIAWYIDKRHISPYLANYAALGLAEAARVTGSPQYSDAAWAWLAWYAAHENSSGFVTDYDVDASGAEISTGDEDSTDAYAGTFLTAVRATFRVDPDVPRLAALHAGISGAVAAIEATQDSDGLTFAKPTWPVKYLMDQAETYRGLVAAVELAAVLGDWPLAWRAGRDAVRLAQGVATLWNPATGAYDWAEHGDGARVVTDWSELYPDAMEQAWIAATTAIPRARAAELVARLNAAQPQWDEPTATALIGGVGGPVGYWPAAGWALLRLGQPDAARTAAASIRSAALDAGRAWPFTIGVAGQLIALESGDSSLIFP